ncbi:prenylated rab acceptor PRA1 [Laetiporus sulphureus 93-53]|uniref:PRA1 family protein n=1 Tax=Laetiporus sulphureus 93-53 TaxID=1314785 RepID=A0A165F4E8_9APHY|nr:prenylated rab acceptor PRA1 [Laetiporus sulphureus 93-53]KZT08363.1 prenylated rab acceptor PRA1 [Laetiporus sulphureus 93-53]
MEALMRVTDTVKAFRVRLPGRNSTNNTLETRLSALRPLGEFFDYHRISKPADMNTATTRISYNTRYFSGNYGVIVATLAVYALITNYLLLVSLAFLIGGFIAINRFAPEPMQVGEHVVTQKSLYTGLFVIGIPLVWFSSPLSTFFWLFGASSFLIIGHASLMEPGIESEYAAVGEAV